MTTMKVTKDACPGFVDGGIAYWERSEDPFHVKAYPKTIRHLAPVQTGKRRSGWMAIDESENAVGFIADGTEVLCDGTEWITYLGPFDRPVCVPLSEYGARAVSRHCEMRRERKRKNLAAVERQTGLIDQAVAIIKRICK